MLATIAWTLLLAGSPAGKLEPDVSREITKAIVDFLNANLKK